MLQIPLPRAVGFLWGLSQNPSSCTKPMERAFLVKLVMPGPFAGHPTVLAHTSTKDVDGPGHPGPDEKENTFQLVSKRA